MEPVNFGVMGASSFALAHTARAIHEARGARFAALATSSAAKAEPFKAFAPDIVVHLDYDAMLADPTIEAVYIPLPNHLHVEWTLTALEAGKHVLTEKPIAMTAPEIDALIAARDRTGLFASEAYMIVHHPQWQRVRTLIDEGAALQRLHRPLDLARPPTQTGKNRGAGVTGRITRRDTRAPQDTAARRDERRARCRIRATSVDTRPWRARPDRFTRTSPAGRPTGSFLAPMNRPAAAGQLRRFRRKPQQAEWANNNGVDEGLQQRAPEWQNEQHET